MAKKKAKAALNALNEWGLKWKVKLGSQFLLFKRKKMNKKFGIYRECHSCQSARDGNNFLAMGVSKMEGGHLSWSITSPHYMLKKRAKEFNVKDASQNY
jgi:hypothetical protein